MSIQWVTGVPTLPARAAASHKGTFGRVAIFAGSRTMSGAAALAGATALRGGAGLVTLGVPSGIQPLVASHEPALMTVPLPETTRGSVSVRAIPAMLRIAGEMTAIACGPGWSATASTAACARALYWSAAVPAVLDADALNGLAEEFRARPCRPKFPRVLTPHPGEFSRLTGLDSGTIQADRENLAAEFAARHGVVLLLKGYQTVITDGSRVAVNTTGNPGLATGGTGDVLTGLVAAFLASGLPAFDAGQLAAHIHGEAGDRVADELSQPGLIATDLPRAIARILAEATHPGG